MWSGPVRFLVMWSPLVAVSIGGGIYLYECVDTFLAPGTGFTMDYATPAGDLKIECATYTVDLIQQTVIANKLVIKKSDGTLVAEVPQLVAKGIAIDEGLAPKVQLKDAELWINRDAKGEFDILKFFAPSEGTSSKQSWQISLKDSKIHLVDYTVPQVARNEIRIASGNFVGMGDDTQGSVSLEVMGLAKGQVSFNKTPGRTVVEGKNVEAKLTEILTRLRSGAEKELVASLNPLGIANGDMSGEFTIDLPEKGKPRFQSNALVTASGLRWGEYRADKVDFKGSITELGLVGKANIGYQGLNGNVDGALTYEKTPAFSGNVKVAGLTPKHLKTLKVQLPKGMNFSSAQTKGYLTYNNGRYSWKGGASATAPAAFGLKSNRVDADITLNNEQLIAQVKPVMLGKTVIQANVAVNLKTQAIAGSFSTPQANARDFAQWLPVNVLESKAQVEGVLSGSVSKPNLYVKGSIDPRVKLGNQSLSFDKADVALRFDGNKFTLDRFALKDEKGSLFANGDIDLKKGLSVHVVANGIDLSKFNREATGKFDMQGTIAGKFGDPKFGGKVQGYSVGYSSIPGTILAIASDFTGDIRAIQFKDIEAMKGASQIRGDMGVAFSDQRLSGMFAVNGIDVRDLYSGPVGGVLDLKNIALTGTLSNPFVSGEFEAKKILAYSFAADSAKGSIRYDGEKVSISEGSATFANGTITDVSGSLDAKTKSGKLNGKFEKLDLSEIKQSAIQNLKKDDIDEDMKTLSTNVTVKGELSGAFELGINKGEFAHLKSDGRVDEVRLNKAFLGSGDWSANFDGERWGANAFIGSLNEYFRIDDAQYIPETGAIGGEFLSYRVPLQELLVAVEPNLNLSDDLRDKLHLINGKLGALVQFGGTVNSPSVQVPELEISDILLGTQNIGNFSINGTFENKTFTFKDGKLVGPKQNKIAVPYYSGVVTLPKEMVITEGTADLKGVIKNGEEFDISGSIYGFPVSKFAALAPSLSQVDVRVNKASFNLKGTKDEPLFTSSLDVSAGLTPEGKKVQTGLLASRLNVKGDVTVRPVSSRDLASLKVDAKTTFALNSIQGSFDTHFLTDSSFGLDRESPFDLSLKLDGTRNITEFLKEANGFDFGDGGANVSGGIDVTNTLANPKISGGFEVKADSVQYSKVEPIIGRPFDTILKNLSASVKIENDSKLGYVVRTQASTATNYSTLDPANPNLGYLKFDGKFGIDDIVKGKPNDKGFLNREFSDATLTSNSLGILQTFLQGSYARTTISTAENSPLRLTGSLGKPKISGDIYFDDVKTIIPTLNPTQEGTQTSSIEPEFDLRFFAKNPMNVRSSLAEVNAKGEGSLKGTLSNLKADGLLTVESGSLLLPGGKVKLSPDGTLRLRYESTSFSNRAQLQANLVGETSLTALKNGVTPERYDIILGIKGDLLADNGLTLTATSQPGDLTQDRILQLLGRTDILENFLQSGVNSSVETELRNALTSFALPSVLNGITNDIAKGFGLDYFGVDYNAFEQASLSFVKSLGGGLYLQGRQQLMQPLPGQPVAYDFRIAYRPRRGPDSIRALSFSVGTDQLRPYKLSIDFSSRIRTTKAPYRSIKLHVPNR